MTNYAEEKLYQAVDTLIGSQTIQERLKHAGMFLIRLDEKDFGGAPDLYAKFKSIHDRLTSVQPAGDEGSLEATTSILNNEAAASLATEILSLMCEVTDRANSMRAERGGRR